MNSTFAVNKYEKIYSLINYNNKKLIKENISSMLELLESSDNRSEISIIVYYYDLDEIKEYIRSTSLNYITHKKRENGIDLYEVIIYKE